MAERRLKFWGWGYEGEGASEAEHAQVKRFYGGMFGLDAFPTDVPRVEDYALPKPRVKPPKSLAAICASDPHTRLVHALGKSFPDAVRVFDRKIPHAPDVVAFPRNEKQVAVVMDWAASSRRWTGNSKAPSHSAPSTSTRSSRSTRPRARRASRAASARRRWKRRSARPASRSATSRRASRWRRSAG